jgi:phospholipid N-methyltransferase
MNGTKKLAHGVRTRTQFVKEFMKCRKTIGSLFPSSINLARSMYSPNPEVDSKNRILEVGSGSGVISEFIYRNLSKNDSLSIVELNTRLSQITNQRLLRTSNETGSSNSFKIINDDILNCNFSGEKFDVVVCSLPFNNFDSEKVEEIFAHLSTLVKPGGELRFFEYILLRRIRIWSSMGLATNLSKIESTLTKYIEKHSASRKPIYKNIPPAMIYSLNF